MSAKKDRNKEAVKRLKAAREHLSAYNSDKPDEEYERRNAAVIDAEKSVPWWRR